MNGLDLLIHLLNSSDTNSEIRLLTSLALGAAFQGNPNVQLKGLNLGFIQYILRLLNTELDENILHRLLYTLSTLLRHFPQAQKNFLEHGGAELMVKILDQNNKIAIRAITLMNDLIIEKDQVMDNKREAYADIQILNQLVDHGWCSRISSRLISFDIDEFDYIEKTINAMIPLIDICRKDFISLIEILEKLNKIYTLNDDLSYKDILNNIQILLTKLRQRSSDDL